MKKFFWMLVLVPAFAQAEVGDTGIGVVVGSPNGVTARHWLAEDRSIEGSAGWSLSKSRFQVNANYLWERNDLIEINGEPFSLFFGGGLSLRTKSGKNDNEVVFGPRVPVGLAYQFANPDLELFTQAALNVGIIPSSDLYLDLNVGLRFLF